MNRGYCPGVAGFKLNCDNAVKTASHPGSDSHQIDPGKSAATQAATRSRKAKQFYCSALFVDGADTYICNAVLVAMIPTHFQCS